MGYLSINNLYKDQTILLERQVYALEKIHGTSAHIKYDGKDLHYYSGGMEHYTFRSIFQHEELLTSFSKVFTLPTIIYGEAYGGKMHRMSDTYGALPRFVAFDVKIEDQWMSVPTAHNLCKAVELEFVDYVLINSLTSEIDAERDKHSIQAIRNGMGEGKLREGIVLRPMIERNKPNGDRLIAKHKRVEFSEIKTYKEVDANKAEAIKNGQAIAEEWVTDMRLAHVLDKCLTPEEMNNLDMKMTPRVIKAVVEDVLKESKGEVEWSEEATKECYKRAALLFKKAVNTL